MSDGLAHGRAEVPLDLRCCTARLRELREAASEDAGAVLSVLMQLARLPVTTQGLKETGVGLELNSPFVRMHVCRDIREQSRHLVHAWKKALGLDGAHSDEAEVSTEVKPTASARRVEAHVTSKVHARTVPDVRTAEAAASVSHPLVSDGPAKRRKSDSSRSLAPDCVNEDIAAVFIELADFEFKKKDTFKALAYKKVAAALRELTTRVRSGAEASRIPGVGKASSSKIDEYLTTGTVQRLEKYRRGEDMA